MTAALSTYTSAELFWLIAGVAVLIAVVLLILATLGGAKDLADLDPDPEPWRTQARDDLAARMGKR